MTEPWEYCVILLLVSGLLSFGLGTSFTRTTAVMAGLLLFALLARDYLA